MHVCFVANISSLLVCFYDHADYIRLSLDCRLISWQMIRHLGLFPLPFPSLPSTHSLNPALLPPQYQFKKNQSSKSCCFFQARKSKSSGIASLVEWLLSLSDVLGSIPIFKLNIFTTVVKKDKKLGGVGVGPSFLSW